MSRVKTLPIRGGNVMVDLEDVDLVVSRRWYLSSGYAKSSQRGTPHTLRLHRLIVERVLGRKLTSSELVDHVNGDRADNRRANLRVASKAQNGQNWHRDYPVGISGFIGVTRDQQRPRTKKRWLTYITREGSRYSAGAFEDVNEAAWMRDQWALALHGDFAVLNFDYEPVNGDAMNGGQ